MRRLDSSLTLKPTVLQVTVERQVVRAKVLAVVSLFPVTAEQDPVEVVERERRDVGLELRALDHAHATSTERLHPVAELRQQLPDRDQRRLDGRTQRHAANNSQQTQCNVILTVFGPGLPRLSGLGHHLDLLFLAQFSQLRQLSNSS